MSLSCKQRPCRSRSPWVAPSVPRRLISWLVRLGRIEATLPTAFDRISNSLIPGQIWPRVPLPGVAVSNPGSWGTARAVTRSGSRNLFGPFTLFNSPLVALTQHETFPGGLPARRRVLRNHALRFPGYADACPSDRGCGTRDAAHLGNRSGLSAVFYDML